MGLPEAFKDKPDAYLAPLLGLWNPRTQIFTRPRDRNDLLKGAAMFLERVREAARVKIVDVSNVRQYLVVRCA